MDPDVRRLLMLGKQQYQNGKCGMAITSFRAALELDPNNQWAKRGLQACKQARQQQSEQTLQNDPQPTNQPPAWRRRRQN